MSRETTQHKQISLQAKSSLKLKLKLLNKNGQPLNLIKELKRFLKGQRFTKNATLWQRLHFCYPSNRIKRRRLLEPAHVIEGQQLSTQVAT